MAVMAAIAALVWPLAVPSTSPARLAALAEEAGLLLAEDRITAARSGRPVVTRIDPVARVVVAGSRGRVLRLPRDVDVDAVTTAACSGDDGSVALSFAPDGRSCGLRLVLSRRQHRAGVEVDWLTGAVGVTGGGRG